ncbi:MAG TPA: CPBP family intramembrane glutamic endopeptidase [Gemmatimonadaceae bacterium]|nr:CPBP family intramembrane glutamic endopeptidase [Gemmatimonadaceae bacterium]
MKRLILTPEAELYATAVVAVYSLSCASLAGYLHARRPGARPATFLPIYVTVMGLAAGLAVVVLELPSVTRASWTTLGLSLPVGVAAGALAGWAGSALKRLGRRWSQRSSRATWEGHRSPGPMSPAGYGLTSLGAPPAVTTVMPDRYMPGGAPVSRRRVLGLWLLAGTLEEVLFRGVLVELISRLPVAALIGPCLVASVAAFALSHVALGWPEVLDKLPLGAITLAIALLTQSVAPAVVAHVFFNVRVWQAGARRGATTVVTGGGQAAARAAHR